MSARVTTSPASRLSCLIWDSADPIARAAATLLHDRGADVFVCGDDAVSFAQAHGGGRMRAVKTNDSANWDRAVAAAGRIDVVVAVPRWPAVGLFLRSDESSLSHAVESLLRPLVGLTRAAGQELVQHGSGKMIFVASGLLDRGVAGLAIQGLVDGALAGLMRSLAVEWASDGVRVNLVAPGWVEGRVPEEEVRAALVSHTPIRRLVRPEEVAAIIAMLADRNCGYATGQVFRIDGGLDARAS